MCPALKEEASKCKQEQQQSKKLAAAAEKQGQVQDMFLIDYGKLNCGKIKSYSAEVFADTIKKKEIDLSQPFFVRGVDKRPPIVALFNCREWSNM